MNASACDQVGLEAPADVVETIAGMAKPVMLAHVVPDADALGSMFGMALALRRDGCEPMVSLPDGSLSMKLAFMADWAQVPVATEADFESADGFIALDTAKKPRCNVAEALKTADWSAGRPLVNIDHHATNTMFGDVNWVVSDATSTAEIVYAYLRTTGVGITPVLASMLFAGIHGDTAGFSLPPTSQRSLAAAASLVGCGADVAELGERLCRSQTRSEFDLLRIIYANTKVLADGAVAYSTANHAEIAGAGCKAADIDDQVSVPRSLSGVRLSLLMTEGNAGKTRINFRGEGNVDVLELARQFNGGGHRQSAGAVVDGKLEDVEERIVAAAVAHIRKFPPTGKDG